MSSAAEAGDSVMAQLQDLWAIAIDVWNTSETRSKHVRNTCKIRPEHVLSTSTHVPNKFNPGAACGGGLFVVVAATPLFGHARGSVGSVVPESERCG